MHVRAARVTDATLGEHIVFAFRDHFPTTKIFDLPPPQSPVKHIFLHVTRRIHCKAQGAEVEPPGSASNPLRSAAAALSFGEDRTFRDATAEAWAPGQI